MILILEINLCDGQRQEGRELAGLVRRKKGRSGFVFY